MKKLFLITVLFLFTLIGKSETGLFINQSYNQVKLFDMKSEMSMNYSLQKRTTSRINPNSPMRRGNPSSLNHGREWLGLGILVIVTAGVNAGYYFVHHLRPDEKKAENRNYETGVPEVYFRLPWKFNIAAGTGAAAIVTYNLTIGKTY